MMPMTPSPRKLITTTFLDRLSRLDSDDSVVGAVTGMLGHDELYEEIPGTDSGMYSVDCGPNQDKILPGSIEVSMVVYQAGETWIFCYVAQKDLAHAWATRHRVELLDDYRVVEVSELTDAGYAVQAYRETFIELSYDDLSPSLLAIRVGRLMSNFRMLAFGG